MDSSLIEGQEGDKQSQRRCLWHSKQLSGYELGNLTSSVCTECCSPALWFDQYFNSKLGWSFLLAAKPTPAATAGMERSQFLLRTLLARKSSLCDSSLLILPEWRQNSEWATKSLKAFHNFQRHFWLDGSQLVDLFCFNHYWPKYLGICPIVLFFHEVFLLRPVRPPHRGWQRLSHFYFLSIW